MIRIKTGGYGKGKATRERILDAAIELFSARGFDGVPVREIARAAGLREGSLYNHFKGKEEILQTIFGLFEAELSAAVAPPVDYDKVFEEMSPETFWRTGFAELQKRMSDPRMTKITRILSMEQFRDARAREFMLQQLVEGPLKLLEMIFAKLQAHGRIKPFPPRLLAREFQAMTVYLVYRATVLDPAMPPHEVEEQVREHLQFFWEVVKR